MRQSFQAAFDDAQRLLADFIDDPATVEAMDAVVAAVTQTFKARGRVLSCGNGGSMADAMHWAEEFSGRFREDREPYPAIALSDITHATCVANDYGFEHVFSRQVEALGHSGDVLLLLTTSGNSANMILAAKAGKARGMTVVGCLGKGGGEVRQLCDIVLHAPGKGSDRIQELHMMALHMIIEAVEMEMKA